MNLQTSGSPTYERLAAGFIHTCALDESGRAHCWGNNDYAQLGDETTSECGGRPCGTSPVPVRGGREFVTLAAGWVHNCGITPDGATYCWGGGSENRAGYLGDGTVRRSFDPIRVASDSMFDSIALGDSHSCALTRSGVAYCWGENGSGQLGDGSRTARATPVAVATVLRFARIAAGAYHTCGLTSSGEAYCWGDNRWGQLGAGEVAYNDVAAARLQPEAVSGDLRFSEISAGWEHTCGLTTNGAAYCWGRNDDARQLGDDSQVTHRGSPAPVAGSHLFVKLSAGALSTCGITLSGESYCWGGNYYGALGDGTTSPEGVGRPVRTNGGPYASVVIGQSHACGISTSRQLRCWGDRSAGQF